MNEFDQFVKHELMIKYYARYTDDFIIIADSRLYLKQLIPIIEDALHNRLKLILHPEKISIQPAHRGVDFLGYVIFPRHRLMRAKTRQRMLRKIEQRAEEHVAGWRTKHSLNQVIHSYLGALSHASSHKLSEYLKNRLWWYTRGQ
jgi:RNA-directed DNA polymerase